VGRYAIGPDRRVKGHGGSRGDAEDVEDDWLASSLDLISERYGWTEEEISKLPYARFAQILRIVAEAKRDEWRDSWRKPAFLGWLNYLLVPTSKGSHKLGLEKWYTSFGLGEEVVISVKEVESVRKKALGVIDRLRATLSRRSRKGGPP
jgi:hypothetical protein